MKKNKICIVASNYYPKITNNLIKGAIKETKKSKFILSRTIIVPGVFEIPFVIVKKINKFDAFVALGCVIKGKTSHFELITQATTNAIMNLSIKYKKPIGNGIISCLNKKQAFERSDNIFKNKGSESMKAVMSVLKLI